MGRTRKAGRRRRLRETREERSARLWLRDFKRELRAAVEWCGSWLYHDAFKEFVKKPTGLRLRAVYVFRCGGRALVLARLRTHCTKAAAQEALGRLRRPPARLPMAALNADVLLARGQHRKVPNKALAAAWQLGGLDAAAELLRRG